MQEKVWITKIEFSSIQNGLGRVYLSDGKELINLRLIKSDVDAGGPANFTIEGFIMPVKEKDS
jgi:hypothetical protein